jgi:hypothetical protein
MMYAQKFAIAIKHNGKVLRENGESVALPFGSEYSILLKNLNSVRALVSVEVDGVNATENTRLIVPANGEVVLERFIKAGNLNEGNRFKFIERTEQIENGPRGIKVEDGIVRVEVQFEQPIAKILNDLKVEPARPVQNPYYPPPHIMSDWLGRQIGVGPIYGNNITSVSDANNTLSTVACSAQQNEVGITVPGSISNQKFTTGSHFTTENTKHSLVLRLVGKVQGQHITKPVTVKTKIECATCGIMNKSTSKFCTECGTSLILV